MRRRDPVRDGRWTAPLLAKELGDVSDQHVWRFLRAQRIDLGGAYPGVSRVTLSS